MKKKNKKSLLSNLERSRNTKKQLKWYSDFSKHINDLKIKKFDVAHSFPVFNTRQSVQRFLETYEYEKKGLNWLQEKVKKIDPEIYSNYDIHNPQRLLRALEVFLETGKKLSSFKSYKIKPRPFKIIKIGLNIERNILYDRINKRVDSMIKDGLIEEASSLFKLQDTNALQTVGYKEIFAFLNNEYTLETAIKNIKKNTRRFAKRQLTWFRKDKEIKWFEPNELNEIKKFISKS